MITLMRYILHNNETGQFKTAHSLHQLQQIALCWEFAYIRRAFPIDFSHTREDERATARHRISLLALYLRDHSADWLADPHDPAYVALVDHYLVTRLTVIIR